MRKYLLGATALRRASFCAVAFPPGRTGADTEPLVPFIHYVPTETQMPDRWR